MYIYIYIVGSICSTFKLWTPKLYIFGATRLSCVPSVAAAIGGGGLSAAAAPRLQRRPLGSVWNSTFDFQALSLTEWRSF